MYVPRTLGKFLVEAERQFPVILLTGPRQVGKTTLLRHLSAPNRTYVSLDDPAARELAREDPSLFLQRFTPPLLIDEIQYAPELFPFIKIVADSDRQPGLFWLTGSQQFHMMQNVTESLAGRVGIVQLLGFSYGELVDDAEGVLPFLPVREETIAREAKRPALDLKGLYQIIWRGAFPAVALRADLDRDLFYSSYVQTYLQRDVRDLARVGDEMAFLRFLRAAAARSAQLLNVADLARDTGVSQNTATHWLSILEATGLVYLLRPFFSNTTKRLVKTPKLYFVDSGLCAYLTEWSSPETLEAGAMAGAILETWVVSEVLKSYRHNGRDAPLYYYRDKDKKEIDLLIVRDGTIHPVEIKKKTNPGKDDTRHFAALGRLGTPVGQGGVVCLASTSLPLGELVHSIPLGSL